MNWPNIELRKQSTRDFIRDKRRIRLLNSRIDKLTFLIQNLKSFNTYNNIMYYVYLYVIIKTNKDNNFHFSDTLLIKFTFFFLILVILHK